MILFWILFNLFVLVMLVHFSLTVSRLSDQNTMLAQRLALLQRRLEQAQSDAARPGAPGSAAPGSVAPGSVASGSAAPASATLVPDRPEDEWSPTS